MLLSQALDLWLERYKPSSRSINEHRLNRFLKFVPPSIPLADVSVHDILRYERGLKAHRFMRDDKPHPYAPKTIRMHIVAVKTFFNWCIKHELIEVNPTRLMDTPLEPIDKSRDKVMSDEDLQVLLAYVQTRPFQKALVTFAYQTAARTGEVCSLRKAHLNLDKPTVVYDPVHKKDVKFYRAIVDGKTGEREVGFYHDAAIALRRWLLMRPNVEHDYVFVTRAGTPLTSNTCKKVMGRLKAGIKRDLDFDMTNCSIQSMRKRMGYAMGDSKAALTLIQEKLGHKNPQTTMIYMPKDSASAYTRAADHIVKPALPESDSEDTRIVSLFPAINE